ncbi:hypothetical protein ES705_36914 [subsurface metagenome]
MRIMEIKNCKECPYFSSQMAQDEIMFSRLQLLCLKKQEGYRTLIPFKKVIDCFKYETDEEIDVMISNLNFDIPDWCPLERKR